MNGNGQDETPTRPSQRPYALPLENGLRRVKLNSVEHDALVASGYVVLEHDDQTAILRSDRRHASDRRREVPRRIVTADTERYRKLESDVLEQLAAELTEMGHPIAGNQLRWVLDEFRRRVMREGGGRSVVSGRLR